MMGHDWDATTLVATILQGSAPPWTAGQRAWVVSRR